MKSNSHPVLGVNAIESVIGRNHVDPREALLTLPDGFYPQAIYGLGMTKELCLVSKFESSVKSPRSPYISKKSLFREPINIRWLAYFN